MGLIPCSALNLCADMCRGSRHGWDSYRIPRLCGGPAAAVGGNSGRDRTMKIVSAIRSRLNTAFKSVLRRSLPGARPWITALAYVAFAFLSLVTAFLIRFEGRIPEDDRTILWLTLPLAVCVKILAAGYFGLMRELPHCAGVDALVRILKSASTSSVAFMIGVILIYGDYGRQFPRSIFIIDFLMSVVFYGGSRFFLRIVTEMIPGTRADSAGRHTLVIGAGHTGEMALQTMSRDFAGSFSVVGFLDDDPAKRGMTMRGHPILGGVDDAPEVIREMAVTEVVIALPRTTKERVRKIVATCSSRNVRFRILPTTRDRLSEGLIPQRLRELRIEDLLGRESVQLDPSVVYQDIEGKRVLVTGAGGSIGSELARQLVKCNPQVLFLLDVAETPLFEINQDLQEIAPGVRRVSLFADIKHKDLIDKLYNQHKPDRVYHAAAFKHVSMTEEHPVEAVFNNVLGTRNLIEAAIHHGVEKFVMVSTDKAIRPTSIMGATKRCAELLLSHMHGLGVQFITVRFGNVLGSSGSVVSVFRKQIANGGPVTITHPDVERYFMTINEAVELLLQAGASGEGGELFLLEMGDPVRIVDLARNMIELSGLELGKDVHVQFTGLKPGEKLTEELVGCDENTKKTLIPKVLLYQRPSRAGQVREFMADLGTLEDAAMRNDDGQTVEALWKIIRRHGDEIDQVKDGSASAVAGKGTPEPSTASLDAKN